MTAYPCLTVHPVDARVVGGGPCKLIASYVARDNRARLGHLCRQCWRALPLDDRDLYAEIEQ